jgi:hypothetical protein
MHSALVTGIVLFFVVVQFVLKPAMATTKALAPMLVNGLLCVALVACALALVLRRRVPQRSRDESADLFWTRAATPALRTWALLEGASLLTVYLYARSGGPAPIGVALVAITLFIVFNPSYLERP